MPHHNPENKNFKLLAVRVLPECASWVRKCLAENIFYYLNNDYRISDDGTSIKRRSEFSSPISDDFFQVGEHGTPRINISAIVGRNGDGKSTLVEIIIRLLNNFALEKRFGEEGSLKKARGLCAELYYQLNDRFYKLEERMIGENQTATNLYSYECGEDGRYNLLSQALDDEVIKESFFYTLVSNYSHYAYNTLEVDREEGYGKDEEHWLHNVFHKNDGYQVPLSIHPYREKGIIDINNETWLSKQRVLMTFVQSYIVNAQDSTEFFKYSGKRAKVLSLTDVGYSKLQKISLINFFKENVGVRLLQEYINSIYDGGVLNLKNIDNIITALDNAYNIIIRRGHKDQLFNMAIEWMADSLLIESNSDLKDLITLLEQMQKSIQWKNGKLKRVCKHWKSFYSLSWIQIQRLKLLIDICDIWKSEGLTLDATQEPIRIKIPYDLPFLQYQSLTLEEKNLQYVLYKTISILETYPSYGFPCYKYSHAALFFNGDTQGLKSTRIENSINKVVTIAFYKLSSDWKSKSHITLKLRQAYNYYKDTSIQNLYSDHNNVQTSQGSVIKLMFGDLSEDQKLRLTDLETLPPSIFKWDILFETEKKGNMVAMETFSSGEKQNLYCQSAIIYHLQNISSIATEQIHYHAVNLFLEEIELYFHPDWQRTFCYELMEMIRTASIKNIDSVNITFVTHSPYILSDIPKTNVLFLKDGRPNYSMQENTFGANINTLLKNGFFLPGLPIGKFARRKIDDMFGKLQSGEFEQRWIDELQSEVMMVGEPYIRHQLMSLIKMRPEAQTDLSSLIQSVQSLQSELMEMRDRIKEMEKVQNILSNQDLNKHTHD